MRLSFHESAAFNKNIKILESYKEFPGVKKMQTLAKMLGALLLLLLLATAANATEYVQPTTENVSVFSANGTKIGIIHKKVPVKLVRESGYMIMIEYSDATVSFAGWAAKSLFVPCTPQTKADETVTTKTGEVSVSGKTEETTEKKSRLSTAESRKKLRTHLKVPVNYIQQTQIDKTDAIGPKAKSKSTEQSKLFMKLNPTDKNADGYAEITVLLQFNRDSIVTYYINEKIAVLEDFKNEASLEYQTVIDLYIQALQKYNEDLRGNFIALCNRAARYEKIIR